MDRDKTVVAGIGYVISVTLLSVGILGLAVTGFNTFGPVTYNGTAVASVATVGQPQGPLSAQYTVTTSETLQSFTVSYCSGSGCNPSTLLQSSFVQVNGIYYISTQTPTMQAGVPYTYFFVVLPYGGGGAASEEVVLTYSASGSGGPLPACVLGNNPNACSPPAGLYCYPTTAYAQGQAYDCYSNQQSTTSVSQVTTTIAASNTTLRISVSSTSSSSSQVLLPACVIGQNNAPCQPQSEQSCVPQNGGYYCTPGFPPQKNPVDYNLIAKIVGVIGLIASSFVLWWARDD